MKDYKLLLVAVAALSSTLVAQECDICDASGRCCTADETCLVRGDEIDGGQCTKRSGLDECGSDSAWTYYCHKPKTCCGDAAKGTCCEEGEKCCSIGVCCPQASTCCGTKCCTSDDDGPSFTFRWYYALAALPILLVPGCCIWYYKRKAAKKQKQSERRSTTSQSNQHPASPPVAAISNQAFDPNPQNPAFSNPQNPAFSNPQNPAFSPRGQEAMNPQPPAFGNSPPPYDMHVNRDVQAPQYASAPSMHTDPQMHTGGHHPSFNRGQAGPQYFNGPNAGQWNQMHGAQPPYDGGHQANFNRGYMGPQNFNEPATNMKRY